MKILYEGVDIYPDISVHRCYHDMYAEKQSDELLLKLNDTRELWDSWNPKKGDTIAIEDGAAKTGKMFVESVIPESGIITLRAYSVPQSAKDKRSKSWEKVKFLQLAQEIAGRHGLTLETYGITDQTYLTQTGKVVRKVRAKSIDNMKRKIRKFRGLVDSGKMTLDSVVQSYASWTGHISHGNTYHLRQNMDAYFFSYFPELKPSPKGDTTHGPKTEQPRKQVEGQVRQPVRQPDHLDRGR